MEIDVCVRRILLCNSAYSNNTSQIQVGRLNKVGYTLDYLL